MTECDAVGPCDHIMQPRCVNCKRERWAPSTWTMSHSGGRCAHCGWVSQSYTKRADYMEAIRGGRKDARDSA